MYRIHSEPVLNSPCVLRGRWVSWAVGSCRQLVRWCFWGERSSWWVLQSCCRATADPWTGSQRGAVWRTASIPQRRPVFATPPANGKKLSVGGGGVDFSTFWATKTCIHIPRSGAAVPLCSSLWGFPYRWLRRGPPGAPRWYYRGTIVVLPRFLACHIPLQDPDSQTFFLSLISKPFI